VLTPSGCTAYLRRQLHDLGQTGCTAGVPPRDQPAARIDRDPAANVELALKQLLSGLPRRADTKVFEVLQFLHAEGVVKFDEVEVLGGDPGEPVGGVGDTTRYLGIGCA
jgi:hypothetical protein